MNGQFSDEDVVVGLVARRSIDFVLAFEDRLVRLGYVPYESKMLTGLTRQADEIRRYSEGEEIKIRFPRFTLSLLNIYQFLEQRLQVVPTCSNAVIERITETIIALGRTDLREALSELLSATYECAVLMRMTQAGFVGEFIPSSQKPRPDLLFDEVGILVECKDGQSDAALKGNLRSIGRWIRERSEQAFAQMSAEDPDGTKCHVACLDLPEGTFQLIASLQREELDKFVGQTYFDADAPRQIWPKALNVMLSSIGFDRHTPLRLDTALEAQHEGWLPPQFVGPMDARLAALYNGLFHTLGGATPYGHLSSNLREF